MIKNVHLGFFINEYYSKPVYIELASFKDANELDYFMDYFYNDNEKLRKLFDEDISEYAIDNIEQFREVEKVSKNNFRGRIAAYYFNELGQLEFLDLPNSKRKPVRDYKTLPDLETCFKYLSNVFNEAVAKINRKYQNKNMSPPKGEFIHYICEKLRQASYEISENELYFLVKYYNKPNLKNRDDCLTLIKANLKGYYAKKEEQKKAEEERARMEEEQRRYEEEVWQEILRESSDDENEFDEGRRI